MRRKMFPCFIRLKKKKEKTCRILLEVCLYSSVCCTDANLSVAGCLLLSFMLLVYSHKTAVERSLTAEARKLTFLTKDSSSVRIQGNSNGLLLHICHCRVSSSLPKAEIVGFLKKWFLAPSLEGKKRTDFSFSLRKAIEKSHPENFSPCLPFLTFLSKC